ARFQRTRGARQRRPVHGAHALRRGRILATSGPTGEPKGVKHVHTTPLAAAQLMGRHVIGIGKDDVAFSAAKLFFSYGLGNAMAFPLSVGATSILLPQRPTTEAVFEVMRRHRPTIFYGVPTLY